MIGTNRLVRLFTKYERTSLIGEIVKGVTQLAEKGLGGCMIGSVRRKELRQAFSIQEHLEILLVIALGKPKETVVIETVGPNGDIKYWRDEKGVHHVPKRSLDEMIIG